MNKFIFCLTLLLAPISLNAMDKPQKQNYEEEETNTFLQSYDQLREQIKNELLACADPNAVSTSLDNLLALCSSKKFMPRS